MKKLIQFAQKAIILKEEKGSVQILLLKYKDTKENSEKIRNKYGFPGGRLNFGENIDESLTREIREETGIHIQTGDPLHIESWIVKKEKEWNQIIAVFRVCKYKSGEIGGYVSDEAKIEKGEWINIRKFNYKKNVIRDEIEAYKKILELLEL